MVIEERNKPFHTLEEFRRDSLRCGNGPVYEQPKQGKIKSFRLEYRYFIPASEVERLTQLAAAENDNVPKADPNLW